VKKVFAIGDVVLDLMFKNEIPFDSKVGGSVLNASCSLSRLGAEVYLLSQIGVDRVGKIIKSFIIENNISIDYLLQTSNLKSNLALAFLDSKNNADYDFYKSDLDPSFVLNYPEEINVGDIIMFGSYFSIRPDVHSHLIKFLKRAKGEGAILIYDPNFRPSYLPKLDVLLPAVIENIALADIIKGSDEDFNNIADADNMEEASIWVRNYSEALLIYTSGSKGIGAICDENRYFSSVKKIEPLSTIGAGDNVNAAIVYYLLRNELEGITNNKIYWKEFFEYAQNFSQDVCLSYENYISKEVAKTYHLSNFV